MRDSYRGLQDRAARRDSLLFRQFQFIETRQRALENVLFHMSFWDRVRTLFDGGYLKKKVDDKHFALLSEAQSVMQEKVQKVKEEMARPKILIPGVNGNG